MHKSENIYLAVFSQNAEYESLFEDDDFRDYELDRDIDQFLDMTDLDEPGDFFADLN